MPDYLALDWEAHQLSGLEASTTRQGVTVRKAFVLTWPAHLDLEKDTKDAADWLKKQLAQEGISTRTVLLSLPRESVVVRRLTVPNVSDDELPALVQMQAATKSATPIDQLELDFLPLPQPTAEGGREVNMWTMPKKKTAKIRAILEGAGLEVQSLGISSVATAELIAREEQQQGLNPQDTSLIIAQHGHRVEITILKEQHVIFSHSTQTHSDEDHPLGDENQIVAEVRRSIGSIRPASGQLNIDRAWLVGEEADVAALAAVMEQRLTCETKTFPPEQAANFTNNAGHWPAPVAAFGGPAGLLACRMEAIIPTIDFQNPRKQRAQRDIQKIRKITAIAAVGVLIVVALGYRWWKISDLENEISEKQTKIAQLQQFVKANAPTMKSAGLVGEWEQLAEKELGQIGQVYAELPGTNWLYLVKYEYTKGPQKTLGKISLTVRAKDKLYIRDLRNKLADRGFRVKPSVNLESDDSDYPVESKLEIEMPVPAVVKTPQPSNNRT